MTEKYNFSLEKAKEMDALDGTKKEEFINKEVECLKNSMENNLGYSIEMSAKYKTANLISKQFDYIRTSYNKL